MHSGTTNYWVQEMISSCLAPKTPKKHEFCQLYLYASVVRCFDRITFTNALTKHNLAL
jgi:hypothetical protein